jgi:hypothetical protein
MTRMIICIPTYGHPHAVGFHTTGVSTKIDIHGYVGGQCDYSLMQSLPPELRVCIFKSDTWALMDSILDLSGVINTPIIKTTLAATHGSDNRTMNNNTTASHSTGLSACGTRKSQMVTVCPALLATAMHTRVMITRDVFGCAAP